MGILSSIFHTNSYIMLGLYVVGSLCCDGLFVAPGEGGGLLFVNDFLNLHLLNLQKF